MTDSEKQIYNIKAQISSYQTQYNSLSAECDELCTAYTAIYNIYQEIQEKEIDIYVNDEFWSGNQERWWNFNSDMMAKSDRDSFADALYAEYEKLYDLHSDKVTEKGSVSLEIRRLTIKLAKLSE